MRGSSNGDDDEPDIKNIDNLHRANGGANGETGLRNERLDHGKTLNFTSIFVLVIAIWIRARSILRKTAIREGVRLEVGKHRLKRKKSNGKFDSDMSSSDFILMEHADAPALSGGKWTDQETLLLLEALEIYKENWNEIAEHVATKTKAQCILHFVQMPIDDAFFDCDDMEDSQKEIADTGATNETAPETIDVKADSKEDQSRTSPVETSNPEDTKEKNDTSQYDSERKKADQVSKPDTFKGKQADQVSEPDTFKGKQADQVSEPDTVEGKPTLETSKLDADEGNAGEKSGEDGALRALTEAFDAVGYISNSGLSFAEVGNPVMALVS
ncbi:SWI/SNF complex subunit SWI3D [Linum grandiflorum]